MPVSKDHPVAVVYYRYDQNAQETAAKDHAHDGIYYVHNGVAVEPLPTAQGGGARVRHVGKWPTVEELYICAASEAQKASGAGPGHGYAGSDIDVKKKKDQWRPWVCKFIHPYDLGAGIVPRPSAWMVDDADDPHNGAFDHLEASLNGACTIHYRHFKNPSPSSQDESDRTAHDPKTFVLRPGSVTAGKDAPMGVWRWRTPPK